MSRVEESLRELVREELKGHKPPPAPDNRQIFWLFLCVANTALFLWLIPETVFTSNRAENLGKVVIWLGSSVFISSFVWFREKLLVFTQSRAVKIVLIVALPMLTLLYISQLEIFTIHPVIEPSNAELIIDGQSISEEDHEDLSVSLNPHKVIVQPVDWTPQSSSDQYPRPRRFKLTREDVFRALLGREQPRWPLVYDVYVRTYGAVDEVIVRSLDHDFDREFRASPDPPLSSDQNPISKPSVTGPRELVYQWHLEPNAHLPLRLPQGKYSIFSRAKLCDGKPEQVDVPAVKSKTTDLQEPCVANR